MGPDSDSSGDSEAPIRTLVLGRLRGDRLGLSFLDGAALEDTVFTHTPTSTLSYDSARMGSYIPSPQN